MQGRVQLKQISIMFDMLQRNCNIEPVKLVISPVPTHDSPCLPKQMVWFQLVGARFNGTGYPQFQMRLPIVDFLLIFWQDLFINVTWASLTYIWAGQWKRKRCYNQFVRTLLSIAHVLNMNISPSLVPRN